MIPALFLGDDQDVGKRCRQQLSSLDECVEREDVMETTRDGKQFFRSICSNPRVEQGS